MMEARLKNLKDYIRPSYFPLIVGAAIPLLTALLAKTPDRIRDTLPVFLLLGILFASGTVWGLIKIRKQITALRQSGELEAVLDDYDKSQSYAEGNLRLGEKYVFGRRTSTLVAYDQIDRLYQSIHKTNFAEDRRMLCARLTDGKRRNLCKLRVRGKSDADVHMIVVAIERKNPNVKLGYKA
jgi:hypothetical protein